MSPLCCAAVRGTVSPSPSTGAALHSARGTALPPHETTPSVRVRPRPQCPSFYPSLPISPPLLACCHAGFHPGVTCDKSKQCPIVGARYKLKGDRLASSRDDAEREGVCTGPGCRSPPKIHHNPLLPLHVTNAGFHPGIGCDESKQRPIVGMRYTRKGESYCSYDLCETEYLKLSDTEKARYIKMAPRAFRYLGEAFDLCETEYFKLSDAEKARYAKVAPSAYRYLDGRLVVPNCFLRTELKARVPVLRRHYV